METSPAYATVAAAYAQAAGARATWLVRAEHAAELIAKAGMLGVHDRLVVFSETPNAELANCFRWQDVTVVPELTPEAFLQGSAGIDAEAQERARLAPEGVSASYAHPTGMSSGRLFWLVPSMGGTQLRVADLRAFAKAARTVGALLIVDNTLPTIFGCHPLALGAHISIENLAGMVDTPLAESVVAVSVARSLGRRGRRKLANPYAEDGFRLLSFAFGTPNEVASSCAPTGKVLQVIARSLDTLAARLQPRFDGAHAVAAYLACHYAVGCVGYPALDTHPDHALAPTVLEHGSGPVVDFFLTGSAEESARARAERFCALYEQTASRVLREEVPSAGPAVSASDDATAFVPGNATRATAQVTGLDASTAAAVSPVLSAASLADPLAPTHLAIVEDAKTCCLRLYMGALHPLSITDSLDQALRLFCNPPEP